MRKGQTLISSTLKIEPKVILDQTRCFGANRIDEIFIRVRLPKILIGVRFGKNFKVEMAISMNSK